VMNFSPDSVQIQLDSPAYTDLISGESVSAQLPLEPYGVRVLVGKSPQTVS
jgi:beta-galactosidase GanA